MAAEPTACLVVSGDHLHPAPPSLERERERKREVRERDKRETTPPTMEHGEGFGDATGAGRFKSALQKLVSLPETQQLDGEGDLVQRSAEHLRSDMAG